VLTVPRALNAHLIWHVHGKLAGGDGVVEGVTDGECELFGGHPEILAKAVPLPSHVAG
jgi:hypothetical protein